MLARHKGDDIAERLLDLAAGVVKLRASIGKQLGSTSLVKPLERCGIARLIDEADQLVAILTAAANTARRRADRSM